MSVMKLVKQVLAPFPSLDHRARRAFTRGRYLLRKREQACQLSAGWEIQTPWEWVGVNPENLDLFFGYYDKSPWNRSETQMLLHGLAAPYGPTIQIRWFDREHHQVRTLANSHAWNLQQGSMTQWLAGQDRVIFNDVVKDQLVSRIVGTDGHEQAVVPMPIQTLHPAGNEAITLNYKRLWEIRPEYGYRAEVRNFSTEQPLDQDGLWKVDLGSGQNRLMVSIAQLLAHQPRPDMNPARTKLNHAIASPNGDRVVFMHHWFNGPRKTSRLYSMDWNGDHLRMILDSEAVSHYHWQDEEHILLFGNTPEHREAYFILNVVDGSFRLIGDPALNIYGDGHPTYAPDRTLILTDCYPDRRYYQHLLLFSEADNKLQEIGQFLHPPCYFLGTRCDLHPRWSPGGRMISFDSVWTGRRKSYIVLRSR